MLVNIECNFIQIIKHNLIKHYANLFTLIKINVSVEDSL